MPRRAASAVKSAGCRTDRARLHDAVERFRRSGHAHAAEQLGAVVDVHRREHERQAASHLVGRDRPDDRAVQREHLLDADRGARVSAMTTRSSRSWCVRYARGERCEVEVQQPREAPSTALGAVHGRAGEIDDPSEPGLEAFVVLGDLLGEVGEVNGEHRVDDGVLVMGVGFE